MIQGVLIVTDQPGQSHIWAMGESADRASAGTVIALEDLPMALLNADRLCVVLPGREVASRRMTLPVRGDKALDEAARLAFDDILAEPIETVHFGVGPLDEGGTRLVSAAPLGWLQGWLDRLAAARIDPTHVTIDHLALPLKGEGAIALWYRGEVIFRSRDGGFSLPREQAGGLLPRLASTDNLLSVTVGGEPSSGYGAPLALADARALGMLYLNGAASGIVDFLRGAFRPNRAIMPIVRPWRLAASLVGAAVLLFGAAGIAEAYRYQAGAQALQQESVQTFRTAFPDTPIRDLPRQARRLAPSRTGSASFLTLAAALTDAIQAQTDIQLLAMRYEVTGDVVADVRLPDADALEDLAAALEAMGFLAESGSNLRANSEGGYAGQITLGGGA